VVLCFDYGNNRLVEFGVIGDTGLGLCDASSSTYVWTFGEPIASVDPNHSQLGRSALLDVHPSPGGAIQTISLRIATTDAPQTLEIYSVDGRKIWHASLVGQAAGSQPLTWNGRAISGRRVQPGVYLAWLVSDHGTSSLRFVRE